MKYLWYSLVSLLVAITLFSCESEPSIKSTNQLYETLYDDMLRGDVKSIQYENDALKFAFDCKGNMTEADFGKGKVYRYQDNGDTIINEVSVKQRVLYVLNKEGKVGQYISQVKNDTSDWVALYKEMWRYKDGLLSEKIIQSKQATKKNYFVNQEVYNRGDRTVEIFKYGKDKSKPDGKGLLRTETRLANDKGHWTSIKELDEDGIPYHKASYEHEYDEKGNWTTIYLKAQNNYTGEETIDTIRRKIFYYKKGACSK